ncbi:MAG: DUF488 family protein [Acidimicrobiia bacterium]
MVDPSQPSSSQPQTPAREAAVLTIGYGGDTVENLVSRLRAVGVTHVADVRSRPASRFRPEYNGPELQARLSEHGIGYVFLGSDLGGRPDDPTCYTADGRVDYRIIKQKPFFQRGLERLRAGSRRRLRICLLCSEGRPDDCHRTKLIAEALVEQFGITVEHIDPDGNLVAHEDALARLNRGQQSLGFIDLLHESSGTYAGDGARR